MEILPNCFPDFFVLGVALDDALHDVTDFSSGLVILVFVEEKHFGGGNFPDFLGILALLQ